MEYILRVFAYLGKEIKAIACGVWWRELYLQPSFFLVCLRFNVVIVFCGGVRNQ